MDVDEAAAQECRFCTVVIRDGDALDATGTAHAACVAAEPKDRSDDRERWRRLRQLWKFAKS